MYRIDELARAAELDAEIIQSYVRQGLVEEPTNPTSGSPLFSQEALRRILLITEVRQLGFTLAETRELLAQDDEPYGAAKSLAERKIAALRGALTELRQEEKALERLLAHCPTHRRE